MKLNGEQTRPNPDMQISWPEVLTISGIVSLVGLFERWVGRYWYFSKQRKKLRIYQVFDNQQDFLTAEQILRKLHTAGLRHDLEDERLFDNSLWNGYGYRVRKTLKRIAASVSTQRYSIKTASQLEPLLYELVQEGMLKTDGEKYSRNR